MLTCSTLTAPWPTRAEACITTPSTPPCAKFSDVRVASTACPFMATLTPGSCERPCCITASCPTISKPGCRARGPIMNAEVAQKADEMEVELCPGIPELLAELHRQDKVLGVVTGNLEQVGWLKLERGGIRHFFDFGSFSDTREKREDIFRHGAELARKLRGPKDNRLLHRRHAERCSRRRASRPAGDCRRNRHLLARRPGEGSADSLREYLQRVANPGLRAASTNHKAALTRQAPWPWHTIS